MEAYREIIDIKDKTLSIQLPDSFKNGKVEVIVLPVEEDVAEPKNRKPSDFRGKLKLTPEQYQDFQKEVKKSRKEWERNI